MHHLPFFFPVPKFILTAVNHLVTHNNSSVKQNDGEHGNEKNNKIKMKGLPSIAVGHRGPAEAGVREGTVGVLLGQLLSALRTQLSQQSGGESSQEALQSAVCALYCF